MKIYKTIVYVSLLSALFGCNTQKVVVERSPQTAAVDTGSSKTAAPNTKSETSSTATTSISGYHSLPSDGGGGIPGSAEGCTTKCR